MLPLGQVVLQSAGRDDGAVALLAERLTEQDVLPDGATEDPGLLRRIRKLPGQRDFPVRTGELPEDCLDHGALPGPHRADDGEELPGEGLEADVLQGLLLLLGAPPPGDILEADGGTGNLQRPVALLQ